MLFFTKGFIVILLSVNVETGARREKVIACQPASLNAFQQKYKNSQLALYYSHLKSNKLISQERPLPIIH